VSAGNGKALSLCDEYLNCVEDSEYVEESWNSRTVKSGMFLLLLKLKKKTNIRHVCIVNVLFAQFAFFPETFALALF